MKTVALEERDLLFVNGDFQLIAEEEEVAQCLELEFGTGQEDWFLNLMYGADHKAFLEKSTDAQARAEVFRVLGNEERVRTINSVEIISDKARRERLIKFDVTLVDDTNLSREVSLDVGP